MRRRTDDYARCEDAYRCEVAFTDVQRRPIPLTVAIDEDVREGAQDEAEE